jgi:hypothetical protein
MSGLLASSRTTGASFIASGRVPITVITFKYYYTSADNGTWSSPFIFSLSVSVLRTTGKPTLNSNTQRRQSDFPARS